MSAEPRPATAAGPMVDVRGVRKVYRRDAEEITVLDGMDLQVPAAEFVALMGPSGSGKTTLLNLIAGIDRPTSGSVVVAGTDVARLSERDLARWRSRNIGFIFQFYNLIPVLTAVENVELPLLLQGVDRRTARAAAIDALHRLGLEEIASKLPEELSGGQSQRVAIARVLAGRPRLVLADEPTGQLDHPNAMLVIDALIESATTSGAALIVNTHDSSIADRFPVRWSMTG
jgi:putative ABC transport system ATP-binding protein